MGRARQQDGDGQDGDWRDGKRDDGRNGKTVTGETASMTTDATARRRLARRKARRWAQRHGRPQARQQNGKRDDGRNGTRDSKRDSKTASAQQRQARNNGKRATTASAQRAQWHQRTTATLRDMTDGARETTPRRAGQLYDARDNSTARGTTPGRAGGPRARKTTSRRVGGPRARKATSGRAGERRGARETTPRRVRGTISTASRSAKRLLGRARRCLSFLYPFLLSLTFCQFTFPSLLIATTPAGRQERRSAMPKTNGKGLANFWRAFGALFPPLTHFNFSCLFACRFLPLLITHFY